MLQKLEKRFAKISVPDLMKYITVLYALGFLISLVNPNFYYQWLMLDVEKLFKGQVWRLFTFIIQPISDNFMLELLALYVYYMIGTNLERAMGTVRFNMFYYTGVLFNELAIIIIYLVTRGVLGTGFSLPLGLNYLNLSMFLAFAMMFPDLQFLFMFIIPVKAKWMGFLYVALLGVDIFDAFRNGNAISGIATMFIILVSMLNFIIYFFILNKQYQPREMRRRARYQRAVRKGSNQAYRVRNEDAQEMGRVVSFPGKGNIARHRCAVCGRTELDDDSLQFRFCSKCDGNYEYCNEHLYTHEHKKNID